jgi:hypothetical protein
MTGRIKPRMGRKKFRPVVFCRPIRGLIFFASKPTVAPWAAIFSLLRSSRLTIKKGTLAGAFDV